MTVNPASEDPQGAIGVEPPSEGPVAGSAVIVLGQAGTALMVLGTVVAAVVDVGAVQVAYLVVCAVLFVAGCGAFALGFLRAVDRSRRETIDLAGLFYLTGAAPRPVRKMLLGLWFTQIAVATVSVAVTQPPWAVMAPVFGIGVLTLWSARHGSFPRR